MFVAAVPLGRLGRIASLLLMATVVLLAGCRSLQPEPEHAADGEALPPVLREFRAAWIATVANIDWPSESGRSVAKQKAELRAMLDQAAALNLNAAIFQVRPHADAFYASEHEPWSAYLTGTQGQSPEPFYDPLAFAIRAAHERGLELHAWFNPFRAGHPADTSAHAPDHIRRTDPELVVEVGDYLWLDPGMPEARAHSHRVIMDVAERYDVDGIHFDDYFYPYPSYAGGADFPDSTSWRRAQAAGTTLGRDDWRRENVNRFIEGLYRDIKATKPHVKLGISPFGIWRPGHPARTTGFDAYAALYADARTWLEEGWVDYFTPQIYYGMDQTAQPYPVMLRWWIEQNARGRHIWAGNFTSRVRQRGARHWDAGELIGQIYATRAQPGASGNVHFSMKALMPVADSLLHPAPDTVFAVDSLIAHTLTADSLAVDALQIERLMADAVRVDSIYTPEPPMHLQDAQRFVDRLGAEPYAYPALPPASPWLDDEPPVRPEVTMGEDAGRLTVALQPAGDEPVRWWVVRWRDGTDWSIDVVPGTERTYVLERDAEAGRPDAVAVSAVDRVGNAGPAAVVQGAAMRSAVNRVESTGHDAQRFTYVEEGIIRGAADEKALALIFSRDQFADGANHIQKVLAAQDVKASFFFTGNFYRNPAFEGIIRTLKTEGHYLGAHSDRHLLYCSWENRDSLLVTKAEFLEDLEGNYREMERFDIQRAEARYFLPSYEWYNAQISEWAAGYGLTLINFTPGTRSNADYTTPDMGDRYVSSDAILQSILTHEREDPHGLNGFLLLTHIGTSPRRTDKLYRRLKELIVTLHERGYRFQRVDELLAP